MAQTLEQQVLAVWQQALAEGLLEVQLEGQRRAVGSTRKAGLKSVTFLCGDLLIEGIEQNPETKSRWAQLAQRGKRIMQFKARGRYFANVCDGVLTRYPAWTSLGLPA